MKILHVIPQLGIGGSENQLYALIINSRSEQVEHEVLYFGDSNDTAGHDLYRAASIDFARVPRQKKRPVRFVRDLAAAIHERAPDVVHCWLMSGAVWGRCGALWAGRPHVLIAYRSSSLARVRAIRWVERLTGKRVHYLANSQACASFISGALDIPRSRINVVYNGIELEPYRADGDRAWLAGEARLTEDATIVTKIGRLTAAKNHPMLLRVAQRCRDAPPVHFVLVGHGEREAELRRMAEELGVRDRVHFMGLRHDVARVLRSSDICCFTSSWEGFPNGLLEGMAAGLPIVTTDFSGVEELITDGANGVIVKRDDDAAAYEAVRAYVEDPARASRLGAEAARTAAERFSMQRMVEQTIGLYRRMRGEPEPSASMPDGASLA